MKHTFLIMLTLLLIAACGSGSQNKEKSATAISQLSAAETANVADSNTVYVYYFHSKQRCKTCIAVEKVVKETIDSSFIEQPKVEFIVVLTDEPDNKALIEKYEISYNSLIISKGENSANITEEAFANAVNKPEALVELIKKEVSNRL